MQAGCCLWGQGSHTLNPCLAPHLVVRRVARRAGRAQLAQHRLVLAHERAQVLRDRAQLAAQARIVRLQRLRAAHAPQARAVARRAGSRAGICACS